MRLKVKGIISLRLAAAIIITSAGMGRQRRELYRLNKESEDKLKAV
jgi:hypothetical protein